MTVDEWEAHTEFALGNMILRYLQEHPAPDENDLTTRLQELGEGFRDLGADHLARLGAKRLVVV